MATLESTIHTRWASKTALNAKLSHELLFTGNQYDTVPPYVVLSREGSSKASQSNRSRYDLTSVRFSIFYADYDQGRDITTQVAKQSPLGFHQDSFDITGDGRALVMVKSNDFAIQDTENGLWLFVVDFEVTYRLP